MQRHLLVIVLGMNRSCTSLCSHIPSALGVDMADKVEGPGSAARLSPKIVFRLRNPAQVFGARASYLSELEVD
jgi:hypothetical protein